MRNPPLPLPFQVSPSSSFSWGHQSAEGWFEEGEAEEAPVLAPIHAFSFSSSIRQQLFQWTLDHLLLPPSPFSVNPKIPPPKSSTLQTQTTQRVVQLCMLVARASSSSPSILLRFHSLLQTLFAPRARARTHAQCNYSSLPAQSVHSMLRHCECNEGEQGKP